MTDNLRDLSGCADRTSGQSDLRDRIAAVLDESLHRQKGIDRPDRFLDWIDTSELADAVIAELGLREEHRERSYGNWPNQPQVIYRKQRRYISEWENDD